MFGGFLDGLGFGGGLPKIVFLESVVEVFFSDFL